MHRQQSKVFSELKPESIYKKSPTFYNLTWVVLPYMDKHIFLEKYCMMPYKKMLFVYHLNEHLILKKSVKTNYNLLGQTKKIKMLLESMQSN